MHPLSRWIRRGATVLAVAVVTLALPGYLKRPEPAVPAASPTPRPALDDVRVRLTRISRLKAPTALAFREGDRGLYVATKDGRVYALRRGGERAVLDIRREVLDRHEQGLLGLAFHPKADVMVVNFVDRDGRARLRAYSFDGRRAGRHRDLLVIDHPTEFHYAGNVAFGPDGYLYVSQGDGGHGTPSANAQRLDVLLGKILRIDVRPDLTYRVPQDNPFVGRGGARPEIWAYGLRNPWRFSFDAVRGDLWIADPGRTAREEIDFEPARSGGGRNYGWNRMEGTSLLEAPPPAEHVLPVHEYGRDHGCAIIGGYVYRGSRIPGLRGAYLFADHCTGRVEALMRSRRGKRTRLLGVVVRQPTAFGEGRAGEIYVLSLTEGIYRIDPL